MGFGQEITVSVNRILRVIPMNFAGIPSFHWDQFTVRQVTE